MGLFAQSNGINLYKFNDYTINTTQKDDDNTVSETKKEFEDFTDYIYNEQ